MADIMQFDPLSEEAVSTPIAGLSEAVTKISNILNLNSSAHSNVALTEVFISANDRYRIYQVANGKRLWLGNPNPVIKKNGTIIDPVSNGFEIDYVGGSIKFEPNHRLIQTDVITADFTSLNADSKTINDIKTSITNIQVIVNKNKGYFADALSLRTAFPTANEGDYAIVGGTTDTFWIWDTDSNDWKDTFKATDLANYYTKSESDNLLNSKQANIVAHGDTIFSDDFYYGGRKTWISLFEKVRSTILTGIVFTNNSDVVATDSLLTAIGKLQAQINLNDSKVGDLNNLTTVTKTDVVNSINEVNAKVSAEQYSTPLDATAPIINLPSTAVKGKMDGSLKGNTLYQVVPNGDMITSIISNTVARIRLEQNGEIVLNNNYSAFSRVFDIKVGEKYFAKLKIKNSSLGRIQNKLSIRYENGSEDIFGSFTATTEAYQILTATKTMKANLMGFTIEPFGLIERDYQVFTPITGTPYENWTADQLNNLINGYWEGLGNSKASRTKSVGKNLFDNYSKIAPTGVTTSFPISTGVEITGTFYQRFPIKLKKGTTYRFNWDSQTISGSPVSMWRLQYSDDSTSNLVLKDTAIATSSTLDVTYVLIYVSTGTTVSVRCTNMMLSEGSTALPYEPYQETELFCPVELGSVPNGIADKFTFDGKYIQRTAIKTNQSGAVNYSDMPTSGSFIAQLASGGIQIGVKGDTLTSTANLIRYQLATPIETQYPASNLIAEPSGTVYVDSAYADAMYYAQGIQVTGRKFKSINKVTLINKELGTEKDITSQCTLNVNKDGFTATGVQATDLLWFSLELDEGRTTPTTNYSYPLNLSGAVSSNIEGIKQLDENLKNTNIRVDGVIEGVKSTDDKIGLLSALQTVDKTSIVGAINENFGHIGNLSTLTTTEKTNLVGATNELNSAIGQIMNDWDFGLITSSPTSTDDFGSIV